MVIMSIPSIRLVPSFFNTNQEEKTKCSLISRTMAVGIGAIALLIGVLILCGIPGLSTLGTLGGSLFTAGGASVALIGACLRCIKESEPRDPEHFTHVP